MTSVFDIMENAKGAKAFPSSKINTNILGKILLRFMIIFFKHVNILLRHDFICCLDLHGLSFHIKKKGLDRQIRV